MICLHCHEKIPRLRAWRTKSQFCSEECAEKYKTQTMERLTEPGEETQPVPPPIHAPDPEDIFDVAELTEGAVAEAEADAPDQGADDDLITAGELEIFGDSLEDSLVRDRDELWQVAEEVTGGIEVAPPDASEAHSGPPREQTAEEALAALIAITDESGDRAAEVGEEGGQESAAEEIDELALAAQSPPEPDFLDGIDLLDDDELERATAPDPVAENASILDQLVQENDWTTPPAAARAASDDPKEGNDEPLVELEAAVVESLAESESPETEPAATEPEPVEAQPVELAAAQPSEEADFTGSILAAAEHVGEGVTPPEAEADPSAEAAAEEVVADEPAEQPVAAPKKKSAKKAPPKLRPATVMAGIYPTPSGGDETAVTSWQEAIDSRQTGQVANLGADMTVEKPLLNGAATSPIVTDRAFHTYCGLKINLDFEFVPPSSVEEGAAPTPAELSEPLQPVEAILWPGGEVVRAVGLGFTDRGPVGRPMLSEPEATAPTGDPTPPEGASFAAGPLEPAEFIYETVSEAPIEAGADDDGDWFTDIEGFESL